MEWRLVASKGRESCRWQTADGSGWIALTLGAQGDITKVVVAASDGRSEIVEGYEQGLNVARRWRNEWKQAEPPRSSTSGPWLPPLPGRPAEPYGEDATPPSYPPDSIPPRSTVPPPEAGRSSAGPLSPTGNASRGRPGGESSPLSPVKTPDPGSSSRNSQSLPPGKPITGPSPTLGHDDKAGAEGRERSWPPRTGSGAGTSQPGQASSSTRSMARQADLAAEAEGDVPPKGSDPSRSPPFGRPR